MVSVQYYTDDFFLNFSILLFFFMFSLIMLTVAVLFISFFKRKKYKPYTPDVSILVPAYNEEKNIEDCLKSIFSSNYPKSKYEVIVIDDGSTDNTPSILDDFKKKHKNITVIKGKHEGKSASLNLGLKKSRYEYILLIDADTTIQRDAIKKLVMPFSDKNVGATTGSCLVKNRKGILGAFQEVEYPYINLIRTSFSDAFLNVSWFLGAFSCYRKDVLKMIGNFKQDTQSEDIDISLEIYSKGFRVVNVKNAYAYTTIPLTLKGLVNQRIRWYVGVLQSLKKHMKLFSKKTSFSINFLFINHYFWTIYAFLSLPLIAYQFLYWLPYNNQSALSAASYTFYWFSFFGAVRVLYMIPVWGLSFVSIFGVMAGIITMVLLIYAIYTFDKKFTLRKILAMLFYFPYTILINLIVMFGIIDYLLFKNKYFKK